MRIALAILGLLVLIAGLAAVKGAQISTLMSFGKKAQQAGPPPEAVSTAAATTQSWEGTLYAVGSVAADKGVGVSSESSGTVMRLHFESGDAVKKGQVLVELDTSVEKAQLAAARARKALASVNRGRTHALVKSDSLPQEQLDQDQATLDAATADMNALSAQIERKVIRAPFSGRLGIRAVNLGQFLPAGTQVTVLEQIDQVYVDFTLPQERLASLQVGMPIRATLAAGTTDSGTISAIDPSVDATTRTIKVRGSIPNKAEHLRPGMYVSVSVILPGNIDVTAIPATALVRAPYGDSVFIVEDAKDEAGNPVKGPDGAPKKVVRQQFVRTGDARGDFTSILEGVHAGQEVVSAGAFKLHNGAPVTIGKDVRPPPELSPHPQNR